MSNLLAKIEADFHKALKAHEAGRVSALRLLLASVKNAAIAARTSAKQVLDDADVEAVLRQEVKKIKDALVDFSKAAREDLVKAAEAELEILQAYLPKGLDEAEVREIVARKIQELKAEGEKEFGKVMKAVQEEIKGRADGQAVAQLIKQKLSKQ